MPASITVRAEWDMGHRLPNHDGACRNLHGHHYVAEVTVSGEISTVPDASNEGMVVDFSEVKTRLKFEVMKLDHRFLLSEYDPLVLNMKSLPGVITVPFVPTAENIALALLRALPTASLVRVWETPTSFAEVVR